MTASAVPPNPETAGICDCREWPSGRRNCTEAAVTVMRAVCEHEHLSHQPACRVHADHSLSVKGWRCPICLYESGADGHSCTVRFDELGRVS